MKKSLYLIFAFAVAMMPSATIAQMSIEEPDEKTAEKVSFADSIQVQSVTMDYFSRALYKHERKLIRQERNDISISGSLLGSLTNLSESWIETSGGDNSMTLLASLTFKHTFKKDKFSVSTNFTSKYGYYRVALDKTDDDGNEYQDPVWFKNQDQFQITVTPSYEMANNWSYGSSFKFLSQYSDGYVSSGSQESYHLKSTFLSPGYLDISVGFIYKSPSEMFPFTITLSPIAMSATYVRSEEVRLNAGYSYSEHTDPEPTSYVEAYGVAPTSTSNYDGGFSTDIAYSKSFGKTDFIKYTTSVYAFYGWMTQVTGKNIIGNYDAYELALEEWNNDQDSGVKPMLSLRPTVRWENTIEIKASKLLTTTLDFQLYYNRAQNRKVQNQTLLSVGLSYSFNSK